MEQIETIIDQIEEVLEKVRPFLQRDGGDVKFVRYDDKTGIVYVTMLGACNGCAFASEDISSGVEVILCEEVPGVSGVRLCDEDGQEITNTYDSLF